MPRGPAHMLWVSSISSSVPCFWVSERSASWKPGSGAMMPMLVITGSVITQATSPGARACSSASTSLKSTTFVIAVASGTIGPIIPGTLMTSPKKSTTSVSSTEPW
jgi:hypothetical protein